MEQETVEVKYWLSKDNGELMADLNIGGKRLIRYSSSDEKELARKVRGFIIRNNLREVHHEPPV